MNLKFLNLILAMAVLSACGSQSSNQAASTTGASNGSNGVSSCVGNCNNWPAAVQKQIILGGNNSGISSITISSDGVGNTLSTSATLKVKVSALPATYLDLQPYTNWSFAYGCVQFTVVVNGATKTTQVLRVGEVNQNAN